MGSGSTAAAPADQPMLLQGVLADDDRAGMHPQDRRGLSPWMF